MLFSILNISGVTPLPVNYCNLRMDRDNLGNKDFDVFIFPEFQTNAKVYILGNIHAFLTCFKVELV